jgi:TPR repeat protein
VIFYREAGDRGNNAAQSNLGAMYAEGQGVPQNFLLAHMWLSLAAASANRIAIKNRDIVAGHMSPEQIAESERLARERQLQRSLPTSSPR